MQNNFLKSSIQQFQYYKSLGDKSFEQLSDDDINWRYSSSSNSIAIIVKHIVGNQLSRWTNFLTEDGEKDWRNRDAEFEDTYTSKKHMIDEWDNGWNCLFLAINNLGASDLTDLVYIRNEGHTITEAIQRQLCHYSYHIGQIVQVAKEIKADEWQSLSIPKNQSSNYNNSKFNKVKSRTHFTKDL